MAALLADADAALLSRLHAESGVVLCLGDFPRGSEFGIDYLSWRTGPKFAGLKLIPPGVHYVHWSAAERGKGINVANVAGSAGSALAPRCGKFVHIAASAVLVWTWDSAVEEFVAAGEAETARYAAGVRNMDFDERLGPYPLDSYKQWLRLTTHVTRSTVERLAPVGGGTISMSRLAPKKKESEKKTDGTAAAATTATTATTTTTATTATTATTLAAGPSKEFYCPLPGRRPKATAQLTAASITKYAFDRSQALGEVLQWLEKRVAIDDATGGAAGMAMGGDADVDAGGGIRACEAALLGELQFAFVAFLVGQSADGFEQWKGLVDIMCRSEDAMLGLCGAAETVTTAVASPWCFEMFLDVLRAQLAEIPEDFFVDIISGGNFMHDALRSMMSILDIDGSMNNQTMREKAEVAAAAAAASTSAAPTEPVSDGMAPPPRLTAAALKLKALAEKRFKWRVTEDVPDHFGLSAGMKAMSMGGGGGTNGGSIFGFADEDGPTVVDLNAVMF